MQSLLSSTVHRNFNGYTIIEAMVAVSILMLGVAAAAALSGDSCTWHSPAVKRRAPRLGLLATLAAASRRPLL